MRKLLLASIALAASTPAVAQEGSGTPGDPIIVEGIRPGEDQPSVVSKLRQMIDETGDNQLARFEDEICPMVIGMPADLTVILTRIIRENIVAAGGTLGGENCKVNAAAIFIDQPQELILALRKSEPNFFMNMTPSEFRQFSAQRRPVYSWHTTNRYTRDGIQMDTVSRNAAATRLYSNVRSEMESGIVVIDRQATIGKSLRQLGDFATMHLMLDVNWRARRMEASSILSLFHGRNSAPPLRMSSFDRNALSGFYLQRENNYTASMQRQNIARSIERQEEGKPAVGTKDEK
jgi:hypothetical protein